MSKLVSFPYIFKSPGAKISVTTHANQKILEEFESLSRNPQTFLYLTGFYNGNPSNERDELLAISVRADNVSGFRSR